MGFRRNRSCHLPNAAFWFLLVASFFSFYTVDTSTEHQVLAGASASTPWPESLTAGTACKTWYRHGLPMMLKGGQESLTTTCVAQHEHPGARQAVLLYGPKSERTKIGFFLVEKDVRDVPFVASYRWRTDMAVPGVSQEVPVESAEIEVEGKTTSVKACNSAIFTFCRMLENTGTFWIDFISTVFSPNSIPPIEHAGVCPYVQWVEDPLYYLCGKVQQGLLLSRLALVSSPTLNFTCREAGFTPVGTCSAAPLLQLLVDTVQGDEMPSFANFLSSVSESECSFDDVLHGLVAISGDSTEYHALSELHAALSSAVHDLEEHRIADKERNGRLLAQCMSDVSHEDCAAFVDSLEATSSGEFSGQFGFTAAYDLHALFPTWDSADLDMGRAAFAAGLYGRTLNELAACCLLFPAWRRLYHALHACRSALRSLRNEHFVPALTAASPTLELPVGPAARLAMYRERLPHWQSRCVLGVTPCRAVADAFKLATAPKAPDRRTLARLETAYMESVFAEEEEQEGGRASLFRWFSEATCTAIAGPDYCGEHFGFKLVSCKAPSASCGFVRPCPFQPGNGHFREFEDPDVATAIPHHVRLRAENGTVRVEVVVVTEAAGRRRGEGARAREVFVSASETKLGGGLTRKSRIFLQLASQLGAHVDAAEREYHKDLGRAYLMQSLYRAVNSLPGPVSGGREAVEEDVRAEWRSEEERVAWFAKRPEVAVLATFLDDDTRPLTQSILFGADPIVFF